MKHRRPLLGRGFENKRRILLARRKGYDTYIDYDGAVRAARSIKKGGTFKMPIEHLHKIGKIK